MSSKSPLQNSKIVLTPKFKKMEHEFVNSVNSYAPR